MIQIPFNNGNSGGGRGHIFSGASQFGLKEKPKKHKILKRLPQNKNKEWGKLNIMDLIPNVMPLLGTADSEMYRYVTGVTP